MSEGETPLTDGVAFWGKYAGEAELVVPLDFASDLERKLAEAKANEAAMSQIAVNCQCPSKDAELAILRGKLAEARTALHQVARLRSMSMVGSPWDELTRLAEIALQALARIDAKGGTNDT